MIPILLAQRASLRRSCSTWGLPLQLAGFLTGAVTQLMWLPMAAFEILLGIWLLVKGVRPTRSARSAPS